MKKLFSLLLALGLIGYTAAGCGKDAEADTSGDADATEETAATDDASESSGGESGDMVSMQTELNQIILSLETKEDVEAADPKIGALFDKMATMMKEGANDPAMAAAQNSPESMKLQEEMSKHIQEISMKNPEVGIALAGVVAKHSKKLLDAATEMLDSPEMKKQLDEAGDALKEAQEELDKLGN